MNGGFPHSMKRLILTLVAALALCLLVGAAAAAPAPESDFVFDPITGTITKYTGTSTDVEVPASIGGVTVKAIGDDAFKNNTALEKVSLPSSVASIGVRAFRNCTSLKIIDIPGTLTHLGDIAFLGCKIKNFDLTVDMDMISPNAFHQSGIETLVIRGRLNEVPDYFLFAINTCEHVRSVTLPEGVTRIGSNAFSDTAMTSFTIPSTVTTIEEGAFAQSTLRSITIPPSVRTIEESAFFCPNLTSVVFSEGLETIGVQAFYSAPLETATLPASLTMLEENVFYSPYLKSVTFKGVPASVSKDAFMSCNNLEAIHVPCSWNQCEAFSFINSPDLAVTRQHAYGGWHTVNGQECRDCLDNCGAYETRPLPAAPQASAPKTGDEANLGLWLALICLSVSGIVILLRKKQHV